jgi:transposase
MERRTFTREFKVEAVKLIQERGVTVAQAARDLGVQGTVLRRWVQECVADSPQAFPGQGQMKPEHAELARLRREVIKLKAERDILKKAAVGSGDQRNTIWDKVELEGDRDGTYGASGLVRGPESGPVASMETGAVVKRDRPGTRQARRIDSWRGVLEWRVHSRSSSPMRW